MLMHAYTAPDSKLIELHVNVSLYEGLNFHPLSFGQDYAIGHMIGQPITIVKNYNIFNERSEKNFF